MKVKEENIASINLINHLARLHKNAFDIYYCQMITTRFVQRVNMCVFARKAIANWIILREILLHKR